MNSLPLNLSSSVFVRVDDERVDMMQCLITGPSDTPYDGGCFQFDIYFPSGYPHTAPLVNLQTTGNASLSKKIISRWWNYSIQSQFV